MKKKLSLRNREALTGLAFVSFWIIGFLALTLYPMAYSFYLSFHKVYAEPTGIRAEAYKLGNYIDAFRDRALSISISQYLSTLVVNAPVIIVAAMIIAMMLNTKVRGVGFFRTVFFLPVIITSGPVISQLIDKGFVALEMGKLMDMSTVYDIMPQFLAQSFDYLISSFIVILWFSGVQVLIFLAGIQRIDKSVYEAGRIDGAGKWEMFWKITLPALSPLIVLNLFYTIIMQSLFPTNPIIIRVSDELFKVGGGFGFSAAISWIYFLIILAIIGACAAAILIIRAWERRDRQY